MTVFYSLFLTNLQDHNPLFLIHCSDVVNTNWKDSPRTVLDIYRELIPTGLRIWIFRLLAHSSTVIHIALSFPLIIFGTKEAYIFFCVSLIHLRHVSGNTDAVVPVTSTRYSINALKLPTVSPWRAWYDNGEVSQQ